VEQGPVHVEESDVLGTDRAVDVDSLVRAIRIVQGDAGARGIGIAADVIDVAQRTQTLDQGLVVRFGPASGTEEDGGRDRGDDGDRQGDSDPPSPHFPPQSGDVAERSTS